MIKKYGDWTVISEQRVCEGKKGLHYKCRCLCGTERDVKIANLKSGISKGCGCVRKRKLLDRNHKHGMKQTKEYRAWCSMKTRCNNPNFKFYSHYGGRGIRVCDKWMGSFPSFYEDVGDSPSPKHQVDRIDNNGDYEPGNVHWVLAAENCRNKRDNRKINGECISTISRRLGKTHSLVANRLARGWSEERAITEKSNAKI